MKKRTLRIRIGQLEDRVIELNRFRSAEFDRIYTARDGHRHILDGSGGHSTPRYFHHGPREDCLPCRDGFGDTADLPRRYPEVEP